MQKGDKARIAPVIIEGEIIDVKFDVNTGEKRVLLAWTGADGVEHARWSAEAELTLVNKE